MTQRCRLTAFVHARPGEISLSNKGVLFLDELPEFQAQVLDSLLQPLKTGEVAIARANHRIVYPARFQLVAAMNLCRCGRALDPGSAATGKQPRDTSPNINPGFRGPPGSIIEEAARPDVAGMTLLRDASERLNLSARGFRRVLKLARTIADLDGAATVGRAHLAEALSYRINADPELREA